MSRLDELIQELCLDGVPNCSLSDVAEYSKLRTDAELVDDTSYVGVDNLLPNKQGKRNSEYVPTEGRLTAFVCGDVLIGNIRPYLKKIWLATHDGGTNGDVLVIHIKDRNKVQPEYLYYVLSSDAFFLYDMQYAKGAKMPRGNKDAIMDYKFSVPPLEVQSEIVRILDNFTELTAELTARKKQYEHYRNKLFSFNVLNCATVGNSLNNIVVMPLGEVGIFTRGSGLQKKDFTQTGVGCIHYGQIYTHYGTYANRTKTFVSQEFAKKARKAKHGDLIIATTSENDEDVCKAVAWLGDEDIAISSDACFYTHSLEPKYVAYYFQTEQFQKQKRGFITGTKVRRVNTSDLAKIKIPVPSIEEQRRIVSILDKFDMLTTSISEGLPKEIELRRKQYEYYRNQLLSFPDNKATA